MTPTIPETVPTTPLSFACLPEAPVQMPLVCDASRTTNPDPNICHLYCRAPGLRPS